jgi:hypothetical protein
MIVVSKENFFEYFKIQELSKKHKLESFVAQNKEYTDFLIFDALDYQMKGVAKTFVFVDTKNSEVAAYLTLVTDAATIENDEKEQLSIAEFPFETIPAIKIAKLAVNSNYNKNYKHIGTFALQYTASVAWLCNRDYAACRVITVDADIEYDTNLPIFYEKNGFKALQSRKYIRKTKTKTMYSDIFCESV